MGESVVTDFSSNDFVTRMPGGGALCFGDSGGPTIAKEDGEYRIVGINSKGNIQDTNYSAYLALPEVQDFLQKTASSQNVEICGVTSDCDQVMEEAPKFKKAVFNYSIEPGAPLTVQLGGLLEAPVSGVQYFLEPGAPDWMRIAREMLALAPPKQVTGAFRVTLTAKAPGGAAATVLQITVKGPAIPEPGCKLEPKPAFIKLGESLVLELHTSGQVNEATIEGHQVVPAPGTKLAITPVKSGVFVAKAQVKGPGGSGSCVARYGVK
jgi:hypothetical protein